MMDIYDSLTVGGGGGDDSDGGDSDFGVPGEMRDVINENRLLQNQFRMTSRDIEVNDECRSSSNGL